MRIEAYNQVQQIYQKSKVNKTQQTSNTTQTAQLQFSSFGREIGVAQAALAGTPDVRENVVNPIKAQIQSGTYSVDNASFAEKLIQRYNAMNATYEEMR